MFGRKECEMALILVPRGVLRDNWSRDEEKENRDVFSD